MNERHIGRIASVPAGEGFGFINIGGVTKEDGAPHDLNTTEDIFLHSDDCAEQLRVGMEVVFDAIPDRKRAGAYRAVGAMEFHEVEVLPARDPIPGFAVVIPLVREVGDIAPATRLPIHAGMKDVPADIVSKVRENAPLREIPRTDYIPGDASKKQEILEWFLATLFPVMASFSADYRVLAHSDAELDREIADAAADYGEMGLDQQIPILHSEVERFKRTRGALALMVEEDLVRHDTIIPMRYLPDLFMAVPVWYYYTNPETAAIAQLSWETPDPRPDPCIEFFCEQVKGQRWADTFQLFNRRVRTLKQYKGETIPPAVARRMRKAFDLFDYVVIATPYHDQAGRDWQSIEWLRAIDPYVLGFKRGVPYFFVLARFSDAGTFPLFDELVGDTIAFLKTNKEKLAGFDQINSPYWVRADGGITGRNPFGTYLQLHVDKLLAAFEQGNLFDWLRQEDVAS